MQAPIDQDVSVSAIQDRDHSIKDVVSRVFPLAEVSWDATAKPGDILYSADFPQALLKQPTTRDKLNNFIGFRSDVKITMVMNTQPFQQGALLAGFFPNTSNLPAKFTNFKSSLRMMSGGQSRIVRVGEEKVEMVFPYALPQPFVPISSDPMKFGTFVVKCLSALGGTGSAKCSFKIFANFENPEPKFPGVSTISPSSKDVKVILDNMPYNELKALLSGISRVEMNTNDANTSTKLVTAPNMALENKEGTSHVINPQDVNLASTKMPSLTPSDMLFASLFKIPILFSSFKVTATQTTPLLWASNVGPLAIQNLSSGLPSNVIEPDYVSSIASLYKFWRGKFKFHFQAFKTEYAVVKLRVFFAPGVDASKADTVDVSQVYSKIVDLNASTHSFEYEVPFVSLTPLLETSSNIGCIGVCLETSLNYSSATVPNFFEIWVSRCCPDLQLGGLQGISYAPYNPLSKSKPEMNLGKSLSVKNNETVSDLLNISTRTYTGIPSTLNANPAYTSMQMLINSSRQFSLTGKSSGFGVAAFPCESTQSPLGQPITFNVMAEGPVSVYSSIGGQQNLVQGDNISFTMSVDSMTAPAKYTVTKVSVKGIDVVICDSNYKTITLPATFGLETQFILFPSTGDLPPPPVTTGTSFKILPSNFSVPDTNNTMDYITFFSMFYAYFRGGVKLRINSESKLNMNVMLDIGKRVSSTKGTGWFTPTSDDVKASSGLPTQLMSLPVEGFAEFEVPYYSKYPFHSARIGQTNGVVPVILTPSSTPAYWEVFRSADTDFEFSLLTGPPLVTSL